jgi:ABC-type antimicrobial peptide transport system permease subunit
MKKTQMKDALRNISRQKVSYLSIILIALLGVTSFLGIDYASGALKKSASDAYEESNFRDIELISTHYLTMDDLEVIRKVEGVADAEPVWQSLIEVYRDGVSTKANYISLTDRISRPEALEGRLPEKDGEAAMEKSLADQMGLTVGDTYYDTVGLEYANNFFPVRFDEESPFVITGIISHPDHSNANTGEVPYLLVPSESINYEDQSFDLKDCFVRAEIVIEKPEGMDRFSPEYEKAVQKVMDSLEEISSERIRIRDDFIREKSLETLADTRRYIEEDRAEKEERKTELEKEAVLLAEEEKALEEREEALSGMEEGSEEYEKALAELKADRKDFKKRKKSHDGDLEYVEESLAYYPESVRQMDDTERGIMEAEPGRWIMYGQSGNASCVQVRTDSENLLSLKNTFSLMFVLIGALVIYATISKMVDEQRTLIGTTKALGFFRREVLAKYLLFGVSSAMAGTILGILTARFALEPFILRGYDVYYTFDTGGALLRPGTTLAVLLVTLILSAGAVCLAAARLLRIPAVALMQPPVPAGRKKSGGKRHALSLYSRLILLNMRSDLKRVLVTIVSIAGCCALIVIGFTLKFAVSGAIDRHYSQVVDFDARFRNSIMLEEEKERIDRWGVESVMLSETPCFYYAGSFQAASLLVGSIEEIGEFYHLRDWETGEPFADTDEGVLIPRRMAEISGLVPGSEFDLTAGGYDRKRVRVAGVFENYIGAPIVMSREYYSKAIDPELEPTDNVMYIRLNGKDQADLEEYIKSSDDIWGFESLTSADEDRHIFDASTSVINAIVALLIFMAALMAGVVLMNLTNIYYLQKKRELTIMRVNGFTVREVIAYMTRETVLTTILGILLGIGEGSAVAYRIVRAMEQPVIQLDRSVSCAAWIMGAVITLVFTVLVNWAVLRKVRDLKLTDVF